VDSPTDEAERTLSTPGVPLTALSMGNVISASTSSGASPGDSVCTTTCGGANSGNTSTGMRIVVYVDATKNTTSPTTTSIRFFSDH